MPNRHRILFVCDSLALGGSERQLTLLIRHLPMEWESRVWSLNGGPFVEGLKEGGSSVILCRRRFRFDISPSFNLWKLLAEWKPDLIHCWGWMGLASALLGSTVLRIPVISTIRTGSIRIDKGRLRAYTQVFLAHLARRIIANSQAGLTAWKVAKSKGRVIYNGFDSSRLRVCPERSTEKSKPFCIIMAARMESVKDYDTFIAAARKLLTSNSGEWRFLAVGSGSLRSKLTRMAKSDVLNGSVIFPEPGTEILPYISQADLGVLLTVPGISEGCSNAIMEYMACGLPVVCSNSGGNRELVIDGETGYVIPPGNIDALIEKILFLRNNPLLAQRMGQTGRSRIMSDFNLHIMISKTLSVYAALLNQSGAY